MTTSTATAPAVNPVTTADLKRARYFGLTIPSPAAELAPEIVEENARDSWPDWTDEGRWVTTDDDGPRPTAGPDFTPSDLDDAEWQGMALRLAGEPMGELVGTNSTSLLLRFAIGQMLGFEARLEAEKAGHDRDYREWLTRIADDLAPAEAGHEWHPAEVVAAIGSVEARRMGP